MRRVLFAVMAFNAACWSESDFRARCVEAGHCLPSVDAGEHDAGEPDAGASDAGLADAGDVGSLTWAEVAAELFPATASTDSSFTLSSLPASSNHFVGGVLTRTGSVICIPYGGSQPLEVPRQGLPRLLEAIDAGGWEGGVLLPDGTVLGLPLATDAFLLLPPDGGSPRLVGGGLSDSGIESPYFEGGVVTRSGKVLLASKLGPRVAMFDPVTERVTALGPAAFTPAADQYGGAVLRADGESAWMVPRMASFVIAATPAGASNGPMLDGYAGGVLLQNGDALLMPRFPRQVARLTPSGIVSTDGPVTQSYFSAAWSTNGFAYAVQTDGVGGKVLIIDADGGVTEVAAPTTDAGVVPVFSGSHYGFVAREDGVIVGCPYSAGYVLLLTPTTRRTVRREVMLSPWLNKW